MVTPKEIVDFSVDYICDLFEAKGSKRGVLHEKIVSEGEKALVSHFKFPLDEENAYCLGRLFRPAYWIFLKDYSCRDEGFPNGGGDPKSNEHYWHLRNGHPDKDEFKNKILEAYELYLATNLEILQSSS